MFGQTNTTYVEVDGVTLSGSLSRVQALLSFYVDAKFASGSGTFITETSADIDLWVRDLIRRYPVEEWEARELARINTQAAEAGDRLEAIDAKLKTIAARVETMIGPVSVIDSIQK